MIKKIFPFFTLSILSLIMFSGVAFAQGGAGGTVSGGGAGGTVGTNNSNSGAQTVELANPLANAGVNSVQTLIGRIINTLLGVVGSLALIMFIYGGFTWMLAAGNESQVQKGKNILIWAIIGMVVIFASYSIVHFVLRSVTQ